MATSDAKPATSDNKLPLIDFSGYFHPKSPEDKAKVIAEVRHAATEFGFFQLKGHGIPLEDQKALMKAMETMFTMPKEEKLKVSFLNNPCRRGYEQSGDSLRHGDTMVDSKEAYYIGRDDPVVEHKGFYGPNLWPDLPKEQFRGPVEQFYSGTSKLGLTIWEILLQALGASPDLMKSFGKRPIVPMKMLRYPSLDRTLPGQYGAGAHTDFGGVTVLWQEPGKEALEVFYKDEWFSCPALEDVFIINCGDMIEKWSGNQFKSARHRVINKSGVERYSCATFWHGDIFGTNPFNLNDEDKETVGQLSVKKFANYLSYPKDAVALVEVAS